MNPELKYHINELENFTRFFNHLMKQFDDVGFCDTELNAYLVRELQLKAAAVSRKLHENVNEG